MRFQIFQSNLNGHWYWHLEGGNGEIMCQGEDHPTEALAKAAVKRIKRGALFAKIVVQK